MIFIVARLMRYAVAMRERSSPAMIRSAFSRAMSLDPESEQLTVAAARAGASLTPSPTISTLRPRC